MTPRISGYIRPPCAICNGPIPLSLLSPFEWRAETEWAKDTHKRPRPFFCGMACFNVSREHECGRPRCKDNWCGVTGYQEGRPTRTERVLKKTEAARQARISKRADRTETGVTNHTDVIPCRGCGNPVEDTPYCADCAEKAYPGVHLGAI